MDIPRTYPTMPDGFTERGATHAEMVAAGFRQGADVGTRRPGEQPLDEMLVDGPQSIGPDLAAQILREKKVRVLCDSAGKIVATWDEGRWWTPSESAEFVRRIVAEGSGPPKPNRHERRRKPPRRR